MSDRQTITRKIQLIPVGDKDKINETYKWLRDGMFNQNKAMNQYISALYTSTIMEMSKDDRKELNQLYGRNSDSKKGSAYTLDIQFADGINNASTMARSVRQDFDKSIKDGLLYGKVSLPTYRKDNPLLFTNNYIRLRKENDSYGFYHEYENHMDFLDELFSKRDPEVFLRVSSKYTFKVVFGNPHKSHEMRCVFQQIFEGNYVIGGSSIQFDKSGKKIILNLSMSIPKQEHKLDENTVVGVDLGINIPAVCGLNNDEYKRECIGSVDDFLRIRTKMQAQKRRLQKALKNANSGHGRNKKLKALDRLKEYEKNFVQTYNHKVSKSVVDFALKNNAKYINIEDLEGFDSSEFILRNWSFYQLQQYITYKAGLHGIEVRKINPYHTSQICSFCGEWHENNRENQSDFICKNPNCKKHGIKINADWNASRNIAKSTDFTETKSKKTKKVS